MGTAASSWREELVRPLLAAYAAVPGVAAVALSGSVARGAADMWSDVEVMVFWERPPTDDDRAQAAANGAAEVRRLFEYDPGEEIWCDDLSAGSERILVEVTHALVSTVEKQLDRLLRQFDPDPLLLNLAQGLLDAKPVLGAELVAGWQNRLLVYPPELRSAVIRRNAQIDHFWRWRMFVDRDNPMLLASAWGEIAGRLYSTVLALNGRFGPGLKSPDALSRESDIAPTNFASRLRDAFAIPPAEQAAVLRQLVLETYDLVEQHVPDVDVARLRAIFENARAPTGPH